MKRRIVYLILLLFTIPLLARGGKPPVIKWKIENPFEQKVFIENKGQYNIQDKVASQDILFGARQDGLEYYFTKNSIWIKRWVSVKRTEQEIEEMEHQEGKKEANKADEKDDKELQNKLVDKFHEINFVNANPEAHITSESQVSQYYNFTIDSNVPVQAHGYKKITYHNLYPGIDMDFIFPEDKQGFEYSFIVHPGADVSRIKMQYSGNEKTNLSASGNIIEQSPYGNFTDHAPIAFLPGLDNKSVNCVFTLTHGEVSFVIGNYDNKSNLVIDPWVSTPTFTGTNSAYNVDWDDAGNCYIYGGSYPWQVEKFDPSGNQLWSYTTTFSYVDEPIYSDFAVDRSSQSVYITEGIDPTYGAQVIKLTSTGNQIKKFGGFKTNEMWRIAFSHCTNEAVIGAGGTNYAYQGCYLDTNLVTLTPVNVLNTTTEFHDVWGLALDNYGYCYMSFACPIAGTFNNVMVKLPLPALAPTQWSVQSGYHFNEVRSVAYSGNNGGYYSNGYNGVTISDSNLYTYDSNILKEWSTSTGKLLNSVTLNVFASDSLVRFAGLTSDECDNIFAGSEDTIFQFDAALNKTNFIVAPNLVYDLSLGRNNILYAAGKQFVEAIKVTINNCFKLSNQVVNPVCSTLGSASIITSGGTGPYIITWNTTPVQKGDTAYNLAPGTYIATVLDNSCFPEIAYDTVQVPPPTIITPTVTVDSPTTCLGTSVNLIAKGATTYTWTPATGLNTSTGDSVIANPTMTTTYVVIGILNGCPDTVRSVVTVNLLPNIQLTPAAPSLCFGQGITWSASGALSYTWSPSSGLSSTTGDNVILNPTSNTTYSITGTDSLGCSDTITAVAYVDSLPSASFVINPPSLCNSQQIQFTNTSIGGNSYLWDFGDGTKDNSVSPVHSYNNAGIYTVKLIVTTASGCSDTTTVTDTIKSVNYGIHIGNAFLPGSGDNINTIFKPEQILCSTNLNYVFRIYSRWGELLYETTDPNQGWDGTYKGKMEQVDVYVYYIQYDCGPCTQFIKGNVTLLK